MQSKLKIKLGTEINTTKEMSENVVQPGIEPGFCRLLVECLNHSATEPTTLAMWLLIDLVVVRSGETFQHIFCYQDHLTTPRSISYTVIFKIRLSSGRFARKGLKITVRVDPYLTLNKGKPARSSVYLYQILTLPSTVIVPVVSSLRFLGGVILKQ